MRRIFTNARDLLIFGIELEEIRDPFRVGSLVLYPDFDLREYLSGYNTDDIDFIIDRETLYAQYRPVSGSRTPLFTPMPEDDSLISFRLFKPGWVSAMGVIPITKEADIEIYGTLGSLKQIFGQIWAQPMSYELKGSDLVNIRSIYNDLAIIPTGYLEVALRRFSRSYQYYSHNEYAGISELDDCLVDLVIALESITSRGGDSIRQSMALRTALLLGNKLTERKKVEKVVKKFYDHRSKILHGSERDKISEKEHSERFLDLEDLRDLVRRAINASIAILKSYAVKPDMASRQPTTMAKLIDDYLFDSLRT